MRAVKIQFSSAPVPLNERLTVVPIDNQSAGYSNFVQTKKGKTKGRITHEMRLTYKYSKWLTTETRILYATKQENNLKTFKSDCVAVLIYTPPKDGKPHDADGIVKAPFDVLTKAQMVQDDRQIKSFLVVELQPEGKGALTLFLGGEYEELKDKYPQEKDYQFHAIVQLLKLAGF